MSEKLGDSEAEQGALESEQDFSKYLETFLPLDHKDYDRFLELKLGLTGAMAHLSTSEIQINRSEAERREVRKAALKRFIVFLVLAGACAPLLKYSFESHPLLALSTTVAPSAIFVYVMKLLNDSRLLTGRILELKGRSESEASLRDSYVEKLDQIIVEEHS